MCRIACNSTLAISVDPRPRQLFVNHGSPPAADKPRWTEPPARRSIVGMEIFKPCRPGRLWAAACTVGICAVRQAPAAHPGPPQRAFKALRQCAHCLSWRGAFLGQHRAGDRGQLPRSGQRLHHTPPACPAARAPPRINANCALDKRCGRLPSQRVYRAVSRR